MRPGYRLACWLVVVPLPAACSTDEPGSQIPRFDDPRLTQGRSTWMMVCRNCHLTGVAGAPAVDDAAAWQSRLQKGRDALYANALQGIGDGDGWRMPPRGGSPALSDDAVRAAVDFMLEAQRVLGDR